MKVKELKQLLENIDDERIIILARDSEGNRFSPLSQIDDESTYLADSTCSGDVGIEQLTPELEKKGYSEEDVLGGEPALVLWPLQ